MTLCTYEGRSAVTGIQTVRARKRQGSSSLDLTIPSRICKDFEVKHVDIFEIEALLDKGDIRLTYRRVYRKR
jgi:hypothetical protein